MFHKIEFHFFFYITAFLCAVTGHFKEYIYFMSFVLIHEMGHIISALYYKWKISKVLVLPFGAITFFDEKVNRPLKEEMVIALSGVFFQTLFYFLLSLNFNPSFFYKIHYFLLFFNLLPIYPLDGAKIIHLCFCYFFSFQKSYKLTMFFSFLTFLIILPLCLSNLVLFFGFVLLLEKLFEELFRFKFLFHKFLLERYLYNFPFRKIKKIKGYHLSKMKRDTLHLFQIEKNLFKEKDILKVLFDNKKQI